MSLTRAQSVTQPDVDILLIESADIWRKAQDVCPDRNPEDFDGPICNRNDNTSSNGWCDPTYCPRIEF